MVDQLQRYGIFSSKRVAEVMEKVDKGLFVPDDTPPYIDSPMTIGYNAIISAPHMQAVCLQLLQDHLLPALDVGSAAPLAGVEHIPELASLSSASNIEKSEADSYLEKGSLSFHVGDGRQGWPEFAPYDAIHVGAAAKEIPQPLIHQLKSGGRMVIPVGEIFQDLNLIDKNLDGTTSVWDETAVRYVPLTSRDAQLRGR
ncbi:hypothetical protein MLD38_021896 [Melastoma candidum]|uniref:Uncharacterized protein n=1 Tax=Melastoma candidum TaxID=119954 RepID=A0ACB9QQM9_9MYRT|nr:hypothetical protein MLD38_021896 [Melastoma candidum]